MFKRPLIQFVAVINNESYTFPDRKSMNDFIVNYRNIKSAISQLSTYKVKMYNLLNS